MKAKYENTKEDCKNKKLSKLISYKLKKIYEESKLGKSHTTCFTMWQNPTITHEFIKDLRERGYEVEEEYLPLSNKIYRIYVKW